MYLLRSILITADCSALIIFHTKAWTCWQTRLSTTGDCCWNWRLCLCLYRRLS